MYNRVHLISEIPPCTFPLLLYPHPLLPLSLGGRWVQVDGTNDSGHVVGGIAKNFMSFQFIDIHDEPCGKTQGHVISALHDAVGMHSVHRVDTAVRETRGWKVWLH